MHYNNKYLIAARDKSRASASKNLSLQLEALKTTNEKDYKKIEDHIDLFALLKKEFNFDLTTLPADPSFYFFLRKEDQLVLICSESDNTVMISAGSQRLKEDLGARCLSSGQLEYIVLAKTVVIKYP